jgi:WD40 repeat protein
LVDLSPNFSPDGRRIALGTADGRCVVLEISSGRTLVTFATRPLVPNPSVLFSPDGTRVFTANVRNEARVWDAATGEPISPPLYADIAWGGARFLPDGRRLVTWSIHTTHLWDGWSGAPVGETIPAGGRVIRFSQDSRSLGTADDRGFAQIWDVPSGQAFTEPMRYGSSGINYLNSSPEISPDGRFLRTQTAEEFHLWSLPPRLPEGTPVPEWLLRLATAFATKTVNDSGQLIDVPDATTRFHDVYRQVIALPAEAPLAEWGRWMLDETADRPIAPGFTCTPADAEKLASALKAYFPASP